MTITGKFDIFLLAGQSNMAGRGALQGSTTLEDPRVLAFQAREWKAAVEPLHDDKPTAGTGLAMTFALEIAGADPDKRVGLIPCAVGGTPIERWLPGADLYEKAVLTAREALGGRIPAGILWHQGENDAQREADAATWGRRLAAVVEGFRRDIATGGTPFIAGELGPFLADRDTCPFHGEINRQLPELAASIPRFACVSAAGLTDIGDSLHFDTFSLREFGRRYARAYRELTRPPGG